jgi:hypothetical protein
MPEALEDFRQPPMQNETAARNICANQKIVSNNYSSFNVLGLSLILALGTTIVVLDLGFEPTVRWWQRRRYRKLLSNSDEQDGGEKGKHSLYGALEWSQTSILQLQRLAHEEAGYGVWSGCDQNVPVTEAGQMLASLNLRNLSHPRLKKGEQRTQSDVQVKLSKPWSVERSDTGMETLVEEGDGRVKMKEGKKTGDGSKGFVIDFGHIEIHYV